MLNVWQPRADNAGGTRLCSRRRPVADSTGGQAPGGELGCPGPV